MGKLKEYYSEELQWLSEAPMADEEFSYTCPWLDEFEETVNCEVCDRKFSIDSEKLAVVGEIALCHECNNKLKEA